VKQHLPTLLNRREAPICVRGHVRPFRREPPVRLTPHDCQRRKTAKLLKLSLTCDPWRVTVQDDPDNSPQGVEAAF